MKMKMPDLHPQQAFSSSQSHTHTPPPPSPTSTLLSPLPVSGSSPLHMQMGAGANRQRRGVAGGPVIKVDLLPVKWQPAHHLDAARLAPVSSSLSLSSLSLSLSLSSFCSSLSLFSLLCSLFRFLSFLATQQLPLIFTLNFKELLFFTLLKLRLYLM